MPMRGEFEYETRYTLGEIHHPDGRSSVWEMVGQSRSRPVGGEWSEWRDWYRMGDSAVSPPPFDVTTP